MKQVLIKDLLEAFKGKNDSAMEKPNQNVVIENKIFDSDQLNRTEKMVGKTLLVYYRTNCKPAMTGIS